MTNEGTPLLSASTGDKALQHPQDPLSTVLESKAWEDHDTDDEPAHDEHRTHTRSESTVLEVTMETIGEVKDAIVETFEEVQETVAHGIEEAKEVFEEEVVVPVQPRSEGDHNRKLSAIALAVLVFYKVSGGPFGCEPAVKAAGPFYALLGFTLFPILWSIPEALITAELGSAYPEPSGGKILLTMQKKDQTVYS